MAFLLKEDTDRLLQENGDRLVSYLELTTAQIKVKPKGVGYITDKESREYIHVSLHIVPCDFDVSCSVVGIALPHVSLYINPTTWFKPVVNRDFVLSDVLGYMRNKAEAAPLTLAEPDALNVVLSGLRLDATPANTTLACDMNTVLHALRENGALDITGFQTGNCKLLDWVDDAPLPIIPEPTRFTYVDWKLLTGGTYFVMITINADGSYIAGSTQSGGFRPFVTTDFGANTAESAAQANYDHSHTHWGFAVSADGLFRLGSSWSSDHPILSSNGGVSYGLIESLPAKSWRNMGVSSSGQCMALMNQTDFSLYMSFNCGISWNAVTAPSWGVINGLHPLGMSSSGDTLVASHSSSNQTTVYQPQISRDGGSSWTDVGIDFTGIQPTMGYVSDDGNIIVIASRNVGDTTDCAVVVVSTDAGDTWTKYENVPVAKADIRGICMDGSGNNILVLYINHDDSLFYVSHSYDQGATWVATSQVNWIGHGAENWNNTPYSEIRMSNDGTCIAAIASNTHQFYETCMYISVGEPYSS